MSTIIENGKFQANERKALGRGLAALLGNQSSEKTSEQSEQRLTSSKKEPLEQVNKLEKTTQSNQSNIQIIEVSLNQIDPNPDQPRKHFNQAKLEELAQSLTEHGLVQPIVVKLLANSRFQIIAGERRWRASKLANLVKIPVIVRESTKSNQSNDLASLIENIQREELSPLELANSYERMIRLHGFTQEALAQKLSISRVTVANTLRLLKLPQSVKDMMLQNKLAEGHARALLGLSEVAKIEELALQIFEQNLTVREVESRVKNHNENPQTVTLKKGEIVEQKASRYLVLEDELRKVLGTKVVIRGNDIKGSIEIYFSGKDSLNRVVHQLRSSQL